MGVAGRGLCSAFLYFTCSLLQNFVTVLRLGSVESLIQHVSVLHLFTESALFYYAFPIGRMLFCFNFSFFCPIPPTSLFNVVKMQCLCAGVFKGSFVLQGVHKMTFMQNCINLPGEIKLWTKHLSSFLHCRKKQTFNVLSSRRIKYC